MVRHGFTGQRLFIPACMSGNRGRPQIVVDPSAHQDKQATRTLVSQSTCLFASLSVCIVVSSSSCASPTRGLRFVSVSSSCSFRVLSSSAFAPPARCGTTRAWPAFPMLGCPKGSESESPKSSFAVWPFPEIASARFTGCSPEPPLSPLLFYTSALLSFMAQA